MTPGLTQTVTASVSIPAHLLTIFQVGDQGSSQELLSVDQEINVLQYCLFSKHFVPMTSFLRDVFFPFRQLSMLSSHLSLGIPPGVFPFIFNFTTTIRVASSALLITWPNHRSVLFLSLEQWVAYMILLWLYRSSIICFSLSITLPYFRSKYSTTDHIHAINQLKEKCPEYNIPLCVAFADYEKAFDSVQTQAILTSLQEQGIEDVYIDILKDIYIRTGLWQYICTKRVIKSGSREE